MPTFQADSIPQLAKNAARLGNIMSRQKEQDFLKSGDTLTGGYV